MSLGLRKIQNFKSGIMSFRETALQFGVPAAFLKDEALLTTRTLKYSCNRSLTHTVREEIVLIPYGFTVIETPVMLPLIFHYIENLMEY